jgi:DNA topoisomerase I
MSTTKILPVETFQPEELARLAGLRYIADEQPGYLRQINGHGFCYFNGSGSRLRSAQHIKRIETLAIPPAWTDVWICRSSDGHLQATGRDARGRKQYIYHERWSEMSNLAKFWRMRNWVKLLPQLRRRIAVDLRGRGLAQKRVLAGMVTLLDLTSIRIGNEEYVRQNNSYGLATLRTRHLNVEGRKALLRFRGKSGLQRDAVVDDRRLVRLLAELKNLRGAHVFQYVGDDGKPHLVDSTMVNDYLRELASDPFTAKDFRTWKASALAAGILYAERDAEKLTVRNRVMKKAICAVSEALGNTPTVCRKYYIHAGLFELYQDAYLKGDFTKLFQRFRPRRTNALSRDEQVLAYFLKRWPQPSK